VSSEIELIDSYVPSLNMILVDEKSTTDYYKTAPDNVGQTNLTFLEFDVASVIRFNDSSCVHSASPPRFIKSSTLKSTCLSYQIFCALSMGILAFVILLIIINIVTCFLLNKRRQGEFYRKIIFSKHF